MSGPSLLSVPFVIGKQVLQREEASPLAWISSKEDPEQTYNMRKNNSLLLQGDFALDCW